MAIFEIICLAKSTKHGGICIAGLKTDGSGWLRPVSNKRDGTLYPEHYTLKDGREPELFDIIKIPCTKPEPKYHQPENWIIDQNKLWSIGGSCNLCQAQQLLNPEVKKHSCASELLGNSGCQIEYEDLRKSRAEYSLALIKPCEIRWKITSYEGRKKSRAIFKLSSNEYNLPITDPVWNSLLFSLKEGTYDCEEVIEELSLQDFEPNKFILTISLSEPFEGRCYKLVAAVINATDVKKRLGSM